MHIVLVGAGEVGFTVAKNLSSDGHNITIVEENEARAAQAEEVLDVMVVRGNGARPSVLAKAGIREGAAGVDMLIGCSNRDEVNLMACWIAKRSGVPHVIARAVGLEFTDNESWAKDLGIDMLVSPERTVAKEIEELLEVRTAIHASEIAGGRAGIYLFRIAQDSPLAGLPLLDIRRLYPKTVMLAVCLRRGDRSFVPQAQDTLEPGDLCYTMCYRSQIFEIESLFQPARTKKLKRVFIIGAGKVGYQTAARLLSHLKGVEVRLVDKDRVKCEKIANELPDSMVLCGNGADAEFLKAEGIASADGYVAATDHDETNLILAVMAKSLGVSKSIAVVRSPYYLGMTSNIPVDAIVNRNQTLADVITRNVRYPGSSRVLTVLEEISAEAVEITVRDNAAAAGRTLAELRMPAGSLVGLLEHNGELFIPAGDTKIEPGDKAVLFGTASVMDAAMKPFAEGNN